MSSFKCSECGQIHDLSQLALVYRAPRHVARLSKELSNNEFIKRIKLNDDLCSIDEELYFIRGVLEVPIKKLNTTFEWGLWARVEYEDFNHYLALWDADIDECEPPLKGWLSGSPPEYPEADDTELAVHMRSDGLRPLFKIVSPDQQLGIDQRTGITAAKVHTFIANIK